MPLKDGEIFEDDIEAMVAPCELAKYHQTDSLNAIAFFVSVCAWGSRGQPQCLSRGSVCPPFFKKLGPGADL